MDKKDIEKLLRVRTIAQQEKDRFLPKWKDLSDYLGLSYGSWGKDTRPMQENPKDQREIYDNTAAEAANLETDGIQGYACGSSIAWFNLAYEREENGEDKRMAEALKKSEDMLYKVFGKSNFYEASRSLVHCVCNFGTGVLWMEDDPRRSVPYFRVLHPKDIDIIENEGGEVDVLFRTFWLTAEELVEQFGDSVPLQVKTEAENEPMKDYQVYSYCGPRTRFGMEDKVEGKLDYICVYWLKDFPDQTIREDEYLTKPFACWRYAHSLFGGTWGVDSPGLLQLSNIKQVNAMCEDRARLSQLTAMPPGKKTRGLKVNLTPNGFTELGPGEDYQMMNVVGNLEWTSAIIQDLQKKIRNAYYADYFLVLTENIERTKTATEVAGLQSEKSAIMASFFSRMANEFLEPVIEWTFRNELVHGRLTAVLEAGEDENGIGNIVDQEIRIDFVSPLAKMQRRASTFSANTSFVQLISQLMQIYPQAYYKLDILKYIRTYIDAYGVDENIVISDTVAQERYAQRVEAQAQLAQQQAQLEQIQGAGKAYKDLSADAGENSAISALVGA